MYSLTTFNTKNVEKKTNRAQIMFNEVFRRNNISFNKLLTYFVGKTSCK